MAERLVKIRSDPEADSLEVDFKQTPESPLEAGTQNDQVRAKVDRKGKIIGFLCRASAGLRITRSTSLFALGRL